MKNIKYIVLLLAGLLLTSCEDVIDVDLTTAPPRLVVDASIDWVEGTDGQVQVIKLTTTTGYYEEEIPIAHGAIVKITNSTNAVFDFIENPNTGNYICDNFQPVVGETYVLTVEWQGQVYTATETLLPVPPITDVVQDNEGGFLNEDIEVRVLWQDNGDEDNYYMVRFDSEVYPHIDFDVIEDEFFQGNEMFDFIWNEDFEAGQEVKTRLYGISEKYFNYMNILIPIAEGGAGAGPFQTTPVRVRGNIINTTNQDNYALGYFRLSQVSMVIYTIQ